MDLRAPLCHLPHACWAVGIANGTSECEKTNKGALMWTKDKEGETLIKSLDWLKTYREATGCKDGSAISACGADTPPRKGQMMCFQADKQCCCACFLVDVIVSVNTEDSWRIVTSLIRLPLFRGHSHDFVSNRVVVSMETGAAPRYVRHRVLVASSNTVGCENYVEHVSYVQKKAIMKIIKSCLLF